MVLLLIAVVQVVVVVRDQIAVELAAREGARAASVAGSPGSAATAAATRSTDLTPLSVTTDVGARHVTVTVRHTSRRRLPLLGTLIGDIEVSARVSMAREPP